MRSSWLHFKFIQTRLGNSAKKKRASRFIGDKQRGNQTHAVKLASACKREPWFEYRWRQSIKKVLSKN